jgi:predicted DNA-binding protein with PD1-like motif
LTPAQNHRCRRLLLRLPHGADLIEDILDQCRAHNVRSGEVRASGWLEDVVLCALDPAQGALGPDRRFAAAQVITLTGTLAEQEGALSLSAHALLCRESDNGIQVLGGLLRSARALSAEVTIEIYDDLILRRSIDPQTGLPALTDFIEVQKEGPAPAPTAPAAPPAARTPAPQPVTPQPISQAPRPAPVAQPAPQAPPPPAAQTPRQDASLRAAQEARIQALRDGGVAKTVPTSYSTKNVAPVKPSAQSSPAPAPPRPADLDKDLDLNDEDEEDTGEALSLSMSTSWDEVKTASEAQAAREAAAAQGPKRGDLLEHPTFGRCTIERVEENQERMSIRVNRSGRLVQLSLEYLALEAAGKEGNARLFRARPRRDNRAR